MSNPQWSNDAFLVQGKGLNFRQPDVILDQELPVLVSKLKYKSGWTFHVSGGYSMNAAFQAESNTSVSGGPGPVQLPCFFIVQAMVIDSRTPTSTDWVPLTHTFTTPPEVPREGWLRWCMQRVLDVESHEAMEFFRTEERLEDGSLKMDQPFFPHRMFQLTHNPVDLYRVHSREEVQKAWDDAASGSYISGRLYRT